MCSSWSLLHPRLEKPLENFPRVLVTIFYYLPWILNREKHRRGILHYTDVIMTTMASQITSLTVVYPTVYSDAYQRKHQSSASLTFVWGIHRLSGGKRYFNVSYINPHDYVITWKRLPHFCPLQRPNSGVCGQQSRALMVPLLSA